MNISKTMTAPRRGLHALLVQTTILFLFAIAAFQPLGASAQDHRVALVIGNSTYDHAPTLPNARHDAFDMIHLLIDLGFTVFGDIDLTHDDMVSQIRQFADNAEDAEIALVYFAGHGIQADGRNYLIPVDARLTTDRDLAFQAIDMSMLVVALERSRFGLILLDACRTNPFVPRMASANPTRNMGHGLARADIRTRSDLLVSYATHPGGVADDGSETDRNSPYTTALLKNLQKDEDLYRVLALVAHDVRDATNGKQNPWIEGMPPREEIRLAQAVLPATTTTDRMLVPEPVTPQEGTSQLEPMPDPVRLPVGPAGGTVVGAPSRAAQARCDDLAAHPSDENKPQSAAGVSLEYIIWEQAIPACEQAVAQQPGDPRLQYQLGRALQSAGRHADAYTAYLLAAEQDYAFAIRNIALLYEAGTGVERNAQTAFRWNLRGSALGHTGARMAVANAYDAGHGVQQDSHKAYSLYVSLLGETEWDAELMAWIGRYHLNGLGNTEEALNWLSKAADMGNAGAMFTIGQHYWTVARSEFASTTWYGREDQLLDIAESWLKKARDRGFDDYQLRETLQYIERRRQCRGTDQATRDALRLTCNIFLI